MVVFDTATQTLSTFASDINPPEPIQPLWVVMHPYGHKLYVFSTYGKNAMNVIDTSTGALSVSYPFPDYNKIGVAPQGRGDPQFTPDGRYLFVMGEPLQITMFDTRDDSVVLRIPKPADSPGSRGPHLGFFFIPN